MRQDRDNSALPKLAELHPYRYPDRIRRKVVGRFGNSPDLSSSGGAITDNRVFDQPKFVEVRSRLEHRIRPNDRFWPKAATQMLVFNLL
jgi:hypothetical protein